MCIPAYNSGPFILEAVQSVLSQSVADLELIVIDDASDRPTEAELDSVSDPRLRVVRNARNLGLVGNWNRCLETAQGDPIVIFHQDDRMRRGFLASGLAALDQHPEAGFVFGNIETIDADGALLGGHWSPEVLPTGDAFIAGEDLTRLLLAHGNVIPCQTVIARSETYAKAGRFDSSLEYAPDLEMWFRFARHSGAVYLARPLVEVRRHDGQESNRFIATAREVDEVRRAFLSYFTTSHGDHDTAPVPMREARRLARRHLRRWAFRNVRESIRRRRLTHAVAFTVSLARMSIATTFGSPC